MANRNNYIFSFAIGVVLRGLSIPILERLAFDVVDVFVYITLFIQRATIFYAAVAIIVPVTCMGVIIGAVIALVGSEIILHIASSLVCFIQQVHSFSSSVVAKRGSTLFYFCF